MKFKVTFQSTTEREYEVDAEDLEKAEEFACTDLDHDIQVSNAWKSDARIVNIEIVNIEKQ